MIHQDKSHILGSDFLALCSPLTYILSQNWTDKYKGILPYILRGFQVGINHGLYGKMNSPCSVNLRKIDKNEEAFTPPVFVKHKQLVLQVTRVFKLKVFTHFYAMYNNLIIRGAQVKKCYYFYHKKLFPIAYNW